MRKPLRKRSDEIRNTGTSVLSLWLLKIKLGVFLSVMHKCSPVWQPWDLHLSAEWFLSEASHAGRIVTTQNPTPRLYWCPMLYLQWKSIPIIIVQQAFSGNPVCTVPGKIVLLQNGEGYLLFQKLFRRNIHESRTNMHWQGTGRAS